MVQRKRLCRKVTVTSVYLSVNPDHIFVFGDNLKRTGKGGAAKLRDYPNTYGFITKKAPNNLDQSFYKPMEYQSVFEIEMKKLISKVHNNPTKTFLISKLGSGLANRYGIFEEVIVKHIEILARFHNVIFLW